MQRGRRDPRGLYVGSEAQLEPGFASFQSQVQAASAQTTVRARIVTVPGTATWTKLVDVSTCRWALRLACQLSGNCDVWPGPTQAGSTGIPIQGVDQQLEVTFRDWGALVAQEWWGIASADALVAVIEVIAGSASGPTYS